MYYFLLGLLILDALLLIPVVLLQAGKGGGLAAMGGGAGTDTLFGGRQAATLLTKATWWCGGAFLVLALAISIMSSGRGVEGRSSIIRGEEAPVTTTAPALPGAQPEAAAPEGGTSPVGAPFEQQGQAPKE